MDRELKSLLHRPPKQVAFDVLQGFLIGSSASTHCSPQGVLVGPGSGFNACKSENALNKLPIHQWVTHITPVEP